MKRILISLAAVLALPLTARSDEPLLLREAFPVHYQYHVSSRVELTGTLDVPPEKDRPAAKPLAITGSSATDYEERVLAVDGSGQVQKTLRIYRRLEMARQLGEQPQKSSLRPEVRRQVILRQNNLKAPFSPDGPLLWGEIELVRRDFTPALTGLLPEYAVRVGDRWTASAAAVEELTGVEKVEDGKIDCRLEEVAVLAGRRHARVSLKGTVRGVNEDGPTRHQVDGYLFFDLESNHLSYLSFKGVHSLLDKDGKESGRIEGPFVLSRQANIRRPELDDSALKGLVLEANPDNTQLLYDNPELGVRFLYARRWRASERGRQVTLDDPAGSGLMLTVESLTRLPTAAQFVAETRDFFQKQKAKMGRSQEPRRLRAAPQELDGFALEIEMNNQKALMDYYVIRQDKGGAILSARLLPRDLDDLRREVERIARSLTITTQQK
jgi:hypothetical protein